MARRYHFQLPMTVPGYQVAMGRGTITSIPGYQTIPPDLLARIDQAGFGQDLVITQHDIDRIPDQPWSAIAAQLGLQWEPIKAPPKKPVSAKAPAKVAAKVAAKPVAKAPVKVASKPVAKAPVKPKSK